MLSVAGAPDGPVAVGIRPEGFVLDEKGPLTCDLTEIEVMGRDAGFLALNGAIAAGAEAAIIPEISKNFTPKYHKIRGRITALVPDCLNKLILQGYIYQ